MSALTTSPYWPFAVLLISIVAVVFMISKLRFHPFIALIVSAILAGLLSTDLPGVVGQHPLVTAVELPMLEFGATAGKIAWVIALAAVIGTAMMKSGAAENIVNWLLRVLGEKQAAVAMLVSGFILSIPVFFDTVFFLLIPLAITLALKTGKNYILYIAAIGGGAAITHILVPPTPGPLIMAETLNIDLGFAIVGGVMVGILPGIIALFVGKWLNRRFDIPVRVPSEDVIAIVHTNAFDAEGKAPSLFMSILPVLLPVALISFDSIANAVMDTVPAWVSFWGNKNIAMALGTVVALWLWVKKERLTKEQLWEGVSTPLEVAGVIILITSAGGAFGAMLKHSGIGEAIQQATTNFNVHYVFLAWLISAVMKTAQGSSTVAMITSASIMVALVGTGENLPYHPIYLFFAISFGSIFISWMNDSGFWVVAKMSRLTEKEALQTWTVLLAIIGFLGMVQVMLLSWILPLK